MRMTSSKIKKKKGYLRPYVKGGWVPIEDDMLLSYAFRNISPSAVVLLLHMLRIDKMLAYKNGDSYSGNFNLTFTEAESFGLARATISRAFGQLEKCGFIETIVQGGLKSHRKTSSVYRIVERWRTWSGLQKINELDKLKTYGKCA